MRTPEEVEAAAGRLRRHRAGEPVVYPRWAGWTGDCDAATLADAWLADHPATDSLPIDAAWLTSAGFGDDPENPGEWLHPVPGGCPGDANRVVAFEPNGGVCLECCNSLGQSTEVISLAPCPTRGQLRRLLAALGVALPATGGGS